MAVNFNIKNIERFLSSIPYKRILLVITLSCGLMLFLPDAFLEKIFLLDLRNKLGEYLGGAFFLSLVVWLIIFSSYSLRKIKKAFVFSVKRINNKFNALSPGAIRIVIEMYQSDSRSVELDASDAITAQLEKGGFISRPNFSSYNTVFDYFLQPWVINYLNKHINDFRETFIE